MTKDIQFYLSKGFDEKAAAYFVNGRKRVMAVFPNPDFTLTLDFDNGDRRLLDCTAFLEKGTVFEPFMDYANFSRVYLDDTHCVAWDIDPEVDSAVVWNNKVDLGSDSCYMNSIPIHQNRKGE